MQQILSSLYDENGILYAFIATFMMILLGTWMGVIWDFLDNLRGTESVTSKKADENLT